ncbi:glycosyltransferase [Enterococcus xiangfangensis]|uniref:glycosyltransferase n=1 Tax=Enterococcus xiangfangensis TaxID=1296537 RepID=UPI0010F77ACB|nr:glycosyltransferase [Enterococcus xiangfangensis]MBM7710565.1 glycosyltransferase involved in cell wall biosynthesis [Enterococcus xiangfangensis]
MFELVVVLYQMTYLESSTITSLNKLLASETFPEIKKILIFDNSKQVNEPEGLDRRFNYHHSPSNVGLAQAYNYALSQCSDETDWLVTLDQDTILTKEYLQELIKTSLESAEATAAIAPVIKDQKQQISPVRSDTLRPLHSTLPQGNQTYSQDIMVINSATALRVSFLQEIGGYNLDFPLDYLDHWLSWEIFIKKKQISILSQKLHHQLSVLNYAEQMNFSRYQAILSAERRYYSFYNTQLLSQYQRQLFLRGCKQILTGNFNYGKITFKFLIAGGDNGDKNTKANQ